MISDEENAFMRMAIDEAKKSTSDDGRTHPLVGAVVVVNGHPHSAHREETGAGDHAEEGLLEKKLPHASLHGLTVYTTLEPCTTRSRLPCADLLSDRKVARVVIGMLDPDQRITGKGLLHLRRHGIAVDLFPSDMMSELEELNRRFIREKEANSMRVALPLGPFRSRAELPAMAAWSVADTAKNILMIGQNLNLIFRQWKFFEQKLQQKCHLRLLIADPNDDALITTMSRGVVEQAFTKPDFRPVLDTIRKLRNALPEQDRSLIEFKVMDYVPTLSFQVMDGESESGTIIIELTPSKIEVAARPHLMLRAGEPAHQEWYQKFLKNCEDMFQSATPWRWEITSTPIRTPEAGVGSDSLSAEDVPLFCEQRGRSIVVWLKNDTLETLNHCQVTLRNARRYSDRHDEFQTDPIILNTTLVPDTRLVSSAPSEVNQLVFCRDAQMNALLSQHYTAHIGRTTVYEFSPGRWLAELLIQANGKHRIEERFFSWERGCAPVLTGDPRHSRQPEA